MQTPPQKSLANPRSEADVGWKIALERWFPQFLRFFYPDLADRIDWSAGFEFCDKELQEITQDSMIGKRLVDMLVRVRANTGEDCLILMHIDIQGDYEAEFEQRMYIYSYKLFDRYQMPVLTLVVLADATAKWRPQQYKSEIWGYTVTTFNFRAVKLLDFKGQEDALLEGDNPFGVIVAIHLLAQRTRRDSAVRYDLKFATTRRLYEKGYGRDDILGFYAFMDAVMGLPEALEVQYHQHIYELEREKAVEYITSAERFGIQKGKRETARKMLAERFDLATIKKITELTDKDIKDLMAQKEEQPPHTS